MIDLAVLVLMPLAVALATAFVILMAFTFY